MVADSTRGTSDRAARPSTHTPTQTPVLPGTERPPPQVTMGLIDYVTAQSLDADYAEVAERAAGRGEPAKSRSGLAALVMLALFGLLVTTAAVQTARNATATQSGHEELVTQIKARSAKVEAQRARANALRQEIDRLQSSYLQATAEGRALSSRLSKLGILTGAAPVTGPGVRVVVDDAPDAASAKQRVLDSDLQKLVNALWSAGAEAISVNGQRLTNLSAIRHAGGAITVNFRSVSRPYVVLAIGNPNQLPARFVETRHGSAWLDYQAAYGLQFEMTPEESLKLPAAPPLVLHHATSPENRP